MINQLKINCRWHKKYLIPRTLLPKIGLISQTLSAKFKIFNFILTVDSLKVFSDIDKLGSIALMIVSGQRCFYLINIRCYLKKSFSEDNFFFQSFVTKVTIYVLEVVCFRYISTF